MMPLSLVVVLTVGTPPDPAPLDPRTFTPAPYQYPTVVTPATFTPFPPPLRPEVPPSYLPDPTPAPLPGGVVAPPRPQAPAVAAPVPPSPPAAALRPADPLVSPVPPAGVPCVSPVPAVTLGGPVPLYKGPNHQKYPLAIGGAFPNPPGSYLYQPAYCIDHLLRGPARGYVPQPGDVVLSTDGSVFWKLMHNLAGTSHPTHSMVVFARPDGTMGILEGGPHDTLKCHTLDALAHLFSYEKEGRVWVRRRAVPLTPEQSARLTEFALEVDGRRFALGRLGLQLTPFRTRGPFRTEFVGKPHGLARHSFFCSELVTEALVYAGLLDAATARPSATYPRDLFFDASINPYLDKHLKLAPCWDPPARWTSTTGGCQPCGKP